MTTSVGIVTGRVSSPPKPLLQLSAVCGDEFADGFLTRLVLGEVFGGDPAGTLERPHAIDTDREDLLNQREGMTFRSGPCNVVTAALPKSDSDPLH